MYNVYFILIPLGIIPKNENIGGEMIEIMQKITKYVPSREKEVTVNIDSIKESVLLKVMETHPVLFGGDQLTMARARSAKRNVFNGDSGLFRLEGLIPVIEDSHSQLTLLSVRNFLRHNYND